MLDVERRQSGYTIEEAAEVLQFHPEAVRYWVRVGELPGVPDGSGNGWLIWPQDLVAFLRRNGEVLPSMLPLAG
jgi:excisionase family DNA binding protein